MTELKLITVIGLCVSILVQIIPGFKELWAKWKWKPAALAAGFLILPLGAWALVCYTTLDIPTPSTDCGINGAWEAIQLGTIAFLSNQGIYHTAKRVKLAVLKLPSVRALNGL